MRQNTTKKNDFARLFISINLDSSFFSEIQGKLLSIHSYAKISPVKDFHLTLKFLGDVKRSDIENICLELSNISFEKFQIGFEKIDIFSNREPYIIFAKANLSQEFLELKKRIGQSSEKEEFFPHVTLMRVKNVVNKELCLSFISEASIETKKKFIVDKFYLMESVLTEFGPIYNVVKSFNSSN